MPHVSFITLSGFRVRERELLELGMTLPGFQERGRALAELPALGLLTLAGLLPEEWTCSYRVPQQADEALADAVAEESPDLVALSALTASIEEAYRLSGQLQRRGLKTVIGGLHATACPDEARQYATAVVTGSGEPVWRDVLADAVAGNLKPLYRASRNGHGTEWAMPRFDLLGPVSRYTIQTQRGCPFSCDFCAASRLLENFREKPADQIRRELAAVTELSPNPPIELADDNTFAGGRDAHEMLDIFQQSGLRWFTESDWRIGERPELLKRLAASGCVQVLVGIESLVFRYPGMGSKLTELERMLRAVEAIQSAGISVNGCFIVGAEGETRRSIERLTEFLLAAPFAELQVTLQTPFPGTSLHQRLKRDGRLLPDRGWSHYTLFDVTYAPETMRVEELERGFREVLKHVFGAESTRRRGGIRRNVWRNNARLRGAVPATE
jgi:radical SAM superfamily enzyme YgiQ (UPF0313 family)